MLNNQFTSWTTRTLFVKSFIVAILLSVSVFTNAQVFSPLTGNPSRPVTYDVKAVIAGQFESFNVPKGVHPRLYFRAEDLPGLRAKTATTQKIPADFYKTIVGLANNADHFTNSIRPIPNRENGSNYDGNVVESAMSRALLYRLDPAANKSKGLEAVTMVKNFLSTWRNGIGGADYNRGNQAAGILHNLSLVYDWCYDLMTPSERKEFIGEIKFKDPKQGVQVGANTNDPNNLSTGLMRALTMLEASTNGAGVYVGWETSYGVSRQNAHNGHHLESSVPGITAFAIAVYDEYPYVWDEVVSDWLFKSVFPTSNFLLEAGMPWQGASYGTARLNPLVKTNWMIYQMQTFGKRKSTFTPNIVDAAHSYLYYSRPDGQMVRMGDTFVSSRAFGVVHHEQLFDLVLFINNIFRDPYLQKEMIYLHTYRNFQPVLGYLLWNETIQPAQSYHTLPTAYYSPYPNGEMTHFTKWVDTINFSSNAMHLNMKIGDLRTWNHEHLDAGSFQIYYKGGLAVDAGVYEGVSVGQGDGFGSEPEAGWDRSTNSHNTILIRDPKMDEKTAPTSQPREQEFNFRGRKLANGGGQHFTWNCSAPVRTLYRVNGIPTYITSNPSAETSPLPGITIPGKGPIEGHIPTAEVISHFIPEGLKPSFTYLKGEMEELYSYRAEEAKRSFVSLDFNDETYPGALIVFDRITSGNKWGDGANYEKYWMLHSMNEPIDFRDEKGYIDYFLIHRSEQVAPGMRYNGQLIVHPLLPSKENLNFELVVGHKVFGQPYRTGRGRMITEEDGQFMILLSPKGKRLTDLMLNVMQVSDLGTKPLPVALIGKEADALVGTKIFDCIVLFSTSGKLIKEKVTIPAAGNEATLKYHIADLTGGAWTVMDAKGQKVATFHVDPKGNIGTFTAPASNAYTLIQTK